MSQTDRERLPREAAYDAIVIGGGPSGSTAGDCLRRQGLSTLLLERQHFPRFSVGESLLPYNRRVLQALEVEDKVRAAGFLPKYGAIFGRCEGTEQKRIDFREGLEAEWDHAWQVERRLFDPLLLDHAEERGLEVCQPVEVEDLLRDGEAVTGVRIRCGEDVREISSRLVVDATGRSAFVGRRLKLMEGDKKKRTASVFAHYRGIPRPPGEGEGDIYILAFSRGWFWVIPFASGTTSVGVVTHTDELGEDARDLQRFLDRMIATAGGIMGELMANAVPCSEFHILKGFAKRARQWSGPGWVLVGDAAAFVDPIFSSGVLLGMEGAQTMAQCAPAALAGGRLAQPEGFQPYEETFGAALEVFSYYIYNWLEEPFQRVFFEPPKKTNNVVKTLTTILAGGVFNGDLIGPGDRLFRSRVLVEERRMGLGKPRERRASTSPPPPGV